MRIGLDGRKIFDFGIGTYVRGLLGGLATLPRRHQYVVLAPQSARSAIPPSMEHFVVDAPHYSLRELTVMGRAADRASLDLLHIPHYVMPLTRVPVVVTIHDLIHLHLRYRNPIAPLYARTMLRRAARRALRIITVSEATKRDLIATLEVEQGRVLVTPNGVDETYTPSNESTSESRYFLYVGNDKPHKNVEVLVEAFRALRTEEPDLELRLAGGGFLRIPPTEGLEKKGFVSPQELLELYRGAVGLVMPSSIEGFGLPALEAMACGTPVITSMDPALVEVTGDSALHVESASANALASAMRQLLHDSDLRSRLAARSLSRSRHFTWRRCAELTERLYTELSEK